MTAVFLPTALVGSSVSLYFTLFIAIFAGLVYAPSSVKRDKRVLAAILFLIAGVIGRPTYAAYTTVCNYAWWAFECWFR